MANPDLPPAPDLPPLFAPMARSFYAQLLLAISVLLNTLGVDFFGTLASMGLGSSPDEVVASGERVVSAWQQVAPLVFGLWAWLERRSPRYRLVFWKKDALPGLDLAPLVTVMAFGAALLVWAGRAQAQGAQCGGFADVMANLATRYGEAELWTGVTGQGALLTVTAHPDGTTWTALIVPPGGGHGLPGRLGRAVGGRAGIGCAARTLAGA